MLKKTLKDVMPTKFNNGEYVGTKAYSMKDIYVVKEHDSFTDQDNFKKWPGSHKNVFLWVELENGHCVGWNENPSRGWSFPVFKKIS
jgi:hypothetical protein